MRPTKYPCVGVYRFVHRGVKGYEGTISRHHKKYKMFFADKRYGGWQGACAVAVAWRRELELMLPERLPGGRQPKKRRRAA